ncbi:MAG: SMP-30/gluconolactonase/LRE family protein [Beijerinckiaceae bacterium]
MQRRLLRWLSGRLRDNLWTSSADAVCCHAPDGTLIGRIPVPESVGNLCFGGPKRNRLYIAAQTSLYSIYLNTHAADFHPLTPA